MASDLSLRGSSSKPGIESIFTDYINSKQKGRIYTLIHFVSPDNQKYVSSDLKKYIKKVCNVVDLIRIYDCLIQDENEYPTPSLHALNKEEFAKLKELVRDKLIKKTHLEKTSNDTELELTQLRESYRWIESEMSETNTQILSLIYDESENQSNRLSDLYTNLYNLQEIKNNLLKGDLSGIRAVQSFLNRPEWDSTESVLQTAMTSLVEGEMDLPDFVTLTRVDLNSVDPADEDIKALDNILSLKSLSKKEIEQQVELLKKFFKNIPSQEKFQILMRYALHKAIAEDKDYTPLLKALIEHTKSAEFFFFLDKTQSKMRIGGTIGINLKGLDLILARLQQKKRYIKELPYKICKSEKALQEQLRELYQSEKSPTRCVFFYKPQSNSAHITPIYIEKDAKGNFRAVTTDSIGLRTNNLPELIRNSIPQEAYLTIYRCSFRRQVDYTNCTIFCIRDFVQFAKHSPQILDWISDASKSSLSAPILDINTHIQDFSILPSQMMKTAQSLKAIETYENQQGSINLNIKYIRKLQSHKETSVAMRNAKVFDLFLKYQALIIEEIISES